MNLIYKDNSNIYQKLLKQLRTQYPEKKFRIKYLPCNGTALEEKIGFMRWREVDLFASGLIKRPYLA